MAKKFQYYLTNRETLEALSELETQVDTLTEMVLTLTAKQPISEPIGDPLGQKNEAPPPQKGIEMCGWVRQYRYYCTQPATTRVYCIDNKNPPPYTEVLACDAHVEDMKCAGHEHNTLPAYITDASGA